MPRYQGSWILQEQGSTSCCRPAHHRGNMLVHTRSIHLASRLVVPPNTSPATAMTGIMIFARLPQDCHCMTSIGCRTSFGLLPSKSTRRCSRQIVKRGETPAGHQVVDGTAQSLTIAFERIYTAKESPFALERLQLQSMNQIFYLFGHTGHCLVTLRTRSVKASFTRSLVSITSA